MKIEKIYQPMPMTGGNILDAKSSSSVDTYSCNYINQLIDIFYPIGSIYMSAKSTSPTELFGGEWVKLEGRFIYASTATSGDNGKDNMSTITGTATEGVALSVAQMPSHRHDGLYWLGDSGRAMSLNQGSTYPNGYAWAWSSGAMDAGNMKTAYTGSGQAHSHQVPFIAVYAWQRIG